MNYYIEAIISSVVSISQPVIFNNEVCHEVCM